MSLEATNRVRVRQIVSLLPGLHLRQLQRLAGLSFNSTRYHVDSLTRSRQIERAEEGGYSRLYPVGTSDSDKELFSLVRRSTDRRILSCMTNARTISRAELCERTGFAKSTISEHLSKLIEAGLVIAREVEVGRMEYELADRVRIKALINVQIATLLEKASDRFIDLWDF